MLTLGKFPEVLNLTHFRSSGMSFLFQSDYISRAVAYKQSGNCQNSLTLLVWKEEPFIKGW